MKLIYIALTLILILASLLSQPGLARAQDETPTPTVTPSATPTPSYWEGVTVSSGNQVIVQRTVTYGDIAVVIAISALMSLIIILAIMLIPRMYLP